MICTAPQKLDLKSNDWRSVFLWCKCQYMNVQKVENKNVHFIRHSSFEFGSKSTFLSLSLYDGPFIDTTVE